MKRAIVSCVAIILASGHARADIVTAQAATASQRLSKALVALQISGGTLKGIADDGSAVLEVTKEQSTALRGNDSISRFSDRVPRQPSRIRLLLSYENVRSKPSREKLQEIGLEIIEDYEPGTFLIVSPKNPFTAANLNGLLTDDNVRFVEPSMRIIIPPNERGPKIRQIPQVIPFQTPNDPLFSQLWGMKNIESEKAWDCTTDAAKIVVAVIDTGVDYSHPDLSGNMWKNPNETENGIDDDGNGLVDDIFGADFYGDGLGTPDGDPMDGDDHGTHCAGTIAGMGNNAIGVTGVVWKTKIMALRFLGPDGGFTEDAVKCIDYAVSNGAHVLSNSWGGGGFSTELESAIQRAADRGVLFVAAAGNSASNNDLDPHYPSSYETDNIMAVAAIEDGDTMASFSCFGKESVDIGAPGRDIISTVRGNDYASFSGTSMATPHVSGAAVLAWAKQFAVPEQSVVQMKTVRDSIYENARVLSSLSDRWGHTSLAKPGGVLNISYLCDDGGDDDDKPGTGPIVAASAQFGFGQIANGDQTIATVEIELTQNATVHIVANSSATVQGGPSLFTTGFSDQPSPHEMWLESQRFVQVKQDGDWHNFGSTVAIQLPKGKHSIHWKVWVSEGTIKLDCGSMLVTAFPLSSGSPSVLMARGSRSERKSVEKKTDRHGNTVLYRTQRGIQRDRGSAAIRSSRIEP